LEITVEELSKVAHDEKDEASGVTIPRAIHVRPIGQTHL
jgi:hypothetical protein